MTSSSIGYVAATLLAFLFLLVAGESDQAIGTVIGFVIWILGTGFAWLIERHKGRSISGSIGTVLKLITWTWILAYVAWSIATFVSRDAVELWIVERIGPSVSRTNVANAYRSCSHATALLLLIVIIAFRARLFEAEATADRFYELKSFLAADQLIESCVAAKPDVTTQLASAPKVVDDPKRRFELYLDGALGRTCEMVCCSVVRRFIRFLDHVNPSRAPTYGACILVPGIKDSNHVATGQIDEYTNLKNFRIIAISSWKAGNRTGAWDHLLKRTVPPYDPTLNRSLIDIFKPGDKKLRALHEEFESYLKMAPSESRSREMARLVPAIKRRLRSLLESGVRSSEAAGKALEERSSLAGIVFSECVTRIDNNLGSNPYANPRLRKKVGDPQKYRSVAVAPIIYRRRKLGVLMVLSSARRSFSESDRQTVQLAALELGHVLAQGSRCGLVKGIPMTQFPVPDGDEVDGLHAGTPSPTAPPTTSGASAGKGAGAGKADAEAADALDDDLEEDDDV